MGLSPSCRLLGLVGKNACVFCFLCCGLYRICSTSCSPLFQALIRGKPMASGLTYQVFVILARFSTACHGWTLFGDSQPYLHWAYSVPTCGHLGHVGIQLVGLLFFPQTVMHCMILGWKTDMMGLMLAFQFTMPIFNSASLNAKIILVFHSIWPNTSLPSTQINYRISCPITIHWTTPNKASQTCWPCQYIRCCTSAYRVHTLNTKTIHSNLNSLNTFTKETSSPNVKLILIR
jgi:multidrug transporter EmrE-like cation transporter